MFWNDRCSILTFPRFIVSELSSAILVFLLGVPVQQRDKEIGGMPLHGTKRSFDLRIVKCTCKFHPKRQEKQSQHIGLGAKVDIASILYSLNTMCGMMGWSVFFWWVQTRNVKIHSSGFYYSATSFTLSGQLISAPSVNFCSKALKQQPVCQHVQWSLHPWQGFLQYKESKYEGGPCVAFRSIFARSSVPR